MTRAEYMAAAGTAQSAERHHQYYAQYVNEHVVSLVLRTIEIATLIESKDPHLNDIPLGKWDAMVRLLPGATSKRLIQNGDFLSLGTGVCILKEAARIAIKTARRTTP